MYTAIAAMTRHHLTDSFFRLKSKAKYGRLPRLKLIVKGGLLPTLKSTVKDVGYLN